MPKILKFPPSKCSAKIPNSETKTRSDKYHQMRSILQAESMATNFIALQCFECSTMQVKQQSKRGNKWTCVVCNQKQSIRKVFAQGPMAKDLRKFVQSFNMSRKFAEEQALDPSPDDGIILGTNESRHSPINKRRSNWSDYLDPEVDCNPNQRGCGEDRENEFEWKIVTELPGEMFKKPKLKNNPSGSRCGQHGEKLFKPDFSKRESPNKYITSQEGEQNYRSATAKNTWERSSYLSQDEEEPASCRRDICGGASKWSKYITCEDNHWQQSGKNFADEVGQQLDNHILVTMTNEESAEDEIHPSFR